MMWRCVHRDALGIATSLLWAILELLVSSRQFRVGYPFGPLLHSCRSISSYQTAVWRRRRCVVSATGLAVTLLVQSSAWQLLLAHSPTGFKSPSCPRLLPAVPARSGRLFPEGPPAKGEGLHDSRAGVEVLTQRWLAIGGLSPIAPPRLFFVLPVSSALDWVCRSSRLTGRCSSIL